MQNILLRYIQGKKVLTLFVATNLIYLLMLLLTIPQVMSYSGEIKLLDMMPAGYTHDYVMMLFDNLGEQGRNAYLFYQLPVDMIYPLLFGITYCLVLAYFLKKINRLHAPYLFLCLLPLIAGLADYLENIGIFNMLIQYPEITPGMTGTTNFFTVTKSVFTTLYFIIFLVVFTGVIVKWVRNKRKLPGSS